MNTNTDIRRRIINIDSNYRADVKQSSTDFRFKTTSNIHNVCGIRLTSIEIPLENEYLIPNSDCGVQPYFIFVDVSGKQHEIKFTGSQQAISAGLTTFFTTMIPNNFITVIQDISGKTRITPTVDGTILFPADSIGKALGFSGSSYPVSASVPLDSPYNIGYWKNPYYFLQLDDMGYIEQEIPFSKRMFTAFAKIVRKNVNGDSILYDDYENCMLKQFLFPTPTTFNGFQKVRLLDSGGRVVDLGGDGFSFAVEISEIDNSNAKKVFSSQRLS